MSGAEALLDRHSATAVDWVSGLQQGPTVFTDRCDLNTYYRPFVYSTNTRAASWRRRFALILGWGRVRRLNRLFR